MMRASFFRRSPLLLLATALVAVTAFLGGGASAEAQAPATVTRWVSVNFEDSNVRVPVKVRAGNYYKVVAIDSAEARVGTVGRVFEGWGLLYAVVVGTDVDVVDFWCTTHPGTATTDDYVGGSFPLGGVPFAHPANPNPGTSRLTLSADAPAEGSTNILESTEYLEIECLPSGTGSDLWQADGSARIRVEIMDYSTDARLSNLTAKSSTDGTIFSALSLSPNFSSAFNNGKIITDYSAAVGNSVTHVKVKPIIAAYPVRATVTVTVNGETVASNSDSSAIAIGDGYNDINVQVTAADGTTTQDYTVTVKKLPAAHLSNLEVLDEYGSLLTRPEFNASHPGQAQVIFVAPDIRRIKVKPHWPAGSTMSVEVSTTDMTYKNRTYSTATVSTSGTESGYLTISDFGGTQLNISVTETINGDSATVEYPNKYVTRELNAANADNYLNYMGLSPNPNARPTSSLQRTGAPGYFNVLQRSRSSAVGLIRNVSYQSAGPLTSSWLPASGYPRILPSDPYTADGGAPQQNSGSITLTPAFDRYVQEYTATVPHEVSSVFVNLSLSHHKATATVNGNSPSTPVSLQVGENVVTVVVTAESGVQRTYTLTITREPSTVTDVDEDPVLNGKATVSYPENGTGPVATYAATDPQGGLITWSLTGDDAGLFTLTGGVLAFATSPDYENPADTNSDNVYVVTVTAA
ncbi:MAG: cadherin-like beta sandwich domain-containing protein, partial [Chloroflexi bacterium]|nr:cadherin-like beta sandwich domain-containing protein [Chloroflexota bacterium]